MTPLLTQVLQDGFRVHCGSNFAFCDKAGVPLTVWKLDSQFHDALHGTPWEKLSGWHVFRHSFASNCAVKGVDQRMIDEWMGHQTEEMRRRYRHLFPHHQQAAMKLVFG
jgi:integrase